MNQPLIGVLPLIDEEKNSYWMLPGYMEGILQAGGIPLMLPPTEDPDVIRQLAGVCSGFLFTGGHDVSPALYHEAMLPECAATSALRDEMETILLKSARETGRPVLGICRGIQFLNAALGGTLYQDLPTQHPSDVEHHQQPPYDVPAHRVTVLPDTPLYELLADLLQDKALRVNSYHHQAVRNLAPSLTVMAVSEDGLIEAVCDETQPFCWAVQWHPEFSCKTDESSRRIFRAFTHACRPFRPAAPAAPLC